MPGAGGKPPIVRRGCATVELARNAAPLAAYGNITGGQFISARIGCQTFGVNGIDIAALCLRPTPK
jgi:hypothetical protein